MNEHGKSKDEQSATLWCNGKIGMDIICECEKVSTFGYGRWMFVQCTQIFFIGLWTFKVLFKVVVSGMLFKIYVCLVYYTCFQRPLCNVFLSVISFGLWFKTSLIIIFLRFLLILILLLFIMYRCVIIHLRWLIEEETKQLLLLLTFLMELKHNSIL